MKGSVQQRHAIALAVSLIAILVSLVIVPVSAATGITFSGDLSIPLDPATSPNTVGGMLVVSSDSGGGWSITVKDNLAGGKTHDGHMQEYSGGTYGSRFLADNMTVSGSAEDARVTDIPVTLTGTPKQLESTGSSAVSLSIPITFSQVVYHTDPRLPTGNYRIVVQFDITEN